MNNSKLTTVFLILAGLIGLYVGGFLTFFPAELQAQSNIIVQNASHFSETRAPGTAILAASIIMVLSIFKTQLRRLSLTFAALFFLSYGIGRLLSLIVDGMPAEGLFYAMIGELVIGLFALILLLKTKNTGNQ